MIQAVVQIISRMTENTANQAVSPENMASKTCFPGFSVSLQALLDFFFSML